MIRQNCRPQGVKYRNAASTASVHTAPIAHAMPTQRKESTNAEDQSMDGLNGVGPNVDVSLVTGGLQAFPAKLGE
ncbi:hypothetical protein Mkiyose1665_49940 [Mycobacterium kiyosense]|nr:hypothetical protein MKCMC460_61990 [Mycobacterium sp. 20KCMC460]GLB92995.1 hypothetical protein SRL2020130_58120 [Mycobacterium kiyosense]GLC04131.1 hypothetical protein SRL2020400_47220 [Mycobacterium kiyosense]GLC11201.1 hypothetical protein SRL2020411_58470 [Mycobacterium kiyosense]GLC17187.1 hypothetical protein SRL2020448_57900 [Mycobacterium kiyosense]